MRTWIRDRGLLLANLLLFVVFIGGMILTGVRVYNDEQAEHGGEPVSLLGYLGTGDFAEATFENWESEFLQMGSYVLLTAYSVPARLVGVQADRRAGTAGRGPPRPRGRPGCPVAGEARRLGAEGVREQSRRPVLPVLPRLLAVARRRRCPGVPATSRWRTVANRCRWPSSSPPPSSGSSRSRTGRASSWPLRPSWASRSTCGSAAPPSRSRSPRPMPRPGPEQAGWVIAARRRGEG